LTGKFCSPDECQTCSWSGERVHPDDIGICTLTGLPIHLEFLTKQNSRLRPLFELLNDVGQSSRKEEFPVLEGALSRKLNGSKCRIVSGAMSPTKNALAVCAEVKLFLGLKTNYLGFVFSPRDREIIGKIAQGKRLKQGWFEAVN
jgi:hypothetical protein